MTVEPSFSQMSYDDQREFIKKQRESGAAAEPLVEGKVFCGSPDCQTDLTGQQCLRVSLAPPGKQWTAMRFCDLGHLLDFLITEEDADGDGQVFTDPSMVELSP